MNTLYYIAPLYNVESICKFGIYSRNEIEQKKIEHRSIANAGIVARRKKIKVFDRSLSDYVNLYINPRNAMLRSVQGLCDIGIIEISGDIVHVVGTVVSKSNAASGDAEYRRVSDGGLEMLDLSRVLAKTWIINDQVGSKPVRNVTLMQEMQSEILIPIHVDNQFIKTVVLRSNDDVIAAICHSLNVGVRVAPTQFF